MGRGRRRPQRSPLARPLGSWATVRDKLDDRHYMISLGSRVSMAVVAFYSGARSLVKGERILATWREESHLWHIQGVGLPPTGVRTQSKVSIDDGRWRISFVDSYDSTSNLLQIARGGSSFDAWMRFPDIAIAQGTVIESALLSVTQGLRTLTGDVELTANDIDNAVAPTTAVEAEALVRTTATTIFTVAQANETVYTLDVTDIVNEVFARGGWVSGNALMLLAHGVSGIFAVWFASIDHTSLNKPSLNLNTESVVPTEQIASTDLSDFEEV